jgi:hypothetical protein
MLRIPCSTSSEEILMENTQSATQFCKLNAPVRDHAGRIHFQEHPRVLRKISNLDRQMLLVQFEDGATTFLFPDEVTLY